MLGSVAEAEDVVQDAWLRWHSAERDGIHEPKAWLVRTVTRLCLDVLKSSRVQREQYIGPWLPEPFIDPDEEDDITLPRILRQTAIGGLPQATALEIDGGKLVAIYVTRNPDKLGHPASGA